MSSSSLRYILLLLILLLAACTPVDQTTESVGGSSIVEERAIVTQSHVDAVQSSPPAPSTPEDFLPSTDDQMDDLEPVLISTQNSGETTSQAVPTNVRVQDDQVYSFPQMMAYDSIPPYMILSL